MLVLSREKNERFVIPGVGTMIIVSIRGKKVRVGFDFDPDFKIYREEVWIAIQKQLAGGQDDETTKTTLAG